MKVIIPVLLLNLKNTHSHNFNYRPFVVLTIINWRIQLLWSSSQLCQLHCCQNISKILGDGKSHLFPHVWQCTI